MQSFTSPLSSAVSRARETCPKLIRFRFFELDVQYVVGDLHTGCADILWKHKYPIW
jgi:hypothetical protein